MKYFVDSEKKPSDIYSNYGKGQWITLKSIADFKETLLNDISDNKIAETISINYTIEKEGDGILILRYLINLCIKLNLKLPKIYSHNLDRKYSIYFENELDVYTKKTDIPYYFEHIKQI